jgi:WD40 repeat protein
VLKCLLLRSISSFLCLGLIGCIDSSWVSRNWDQAIADIKIGVTKKSDIPKILGEPQIEAGSYVLSQGHEAGYALLLPGGGIVGREVGATALLRSNEAGLIDKIAVERRPHGGGHPSRRKKVQPLNGNPSVNLQRRLLFPAGKMIPFSHNLGEEGFSSLAIPNDGKIIAASKVHGEVWVYDFEKKLKSKFKIEVPWSDNLVSLAITPDGERLFARSQTVSVRNLPSGKEKFAFRHDIKDLFSTRPGATALAIGPKGKLTATGGLHGKVKLWDASTGRTINSFQAGKCLSSCSAPWIASLAFSADGRTLATTSVNDHKNGKYIIGSLRFWDVRTGINRPITLKRQGPASKVLFSPDGKLLAIATEYHVEIWPIGKIENTSKSSSPVLLEEPLHVFLLPFIDNSSGSGLSYSPWGSFPVDLSFSPDSRLIAVCTAAGGTVILDLKDSIQLWRKEIETRHEKAFLRSVTRFNRTHDCKFSSDGRFLISAHDTGVYIWDLSKIHNPKVSRFVQ